MGKLKAGNCVICGKKLKRHDPMREQLRVGENNGQVAHREAHLACLERK